MTEVAAALEEIRRAADDENRPGLWTARVESIDDPLQMNRVKVRVLLIHGENRQTPIDSLPWAEVADHGGGGPDFGSTPRYQVGSTVWVMFEMGDDEFPVVMGGRRGASTTRDEKNPIEFLTLGGKDDSTLEKPWLPAEGNELPKDVFADSDNRDRHPTRTVWQKSYKGHTILVEDRDGQEFLKIIDRVGQVIEMHCPVTLKNNENNASQRGTSDASRNNQLSQDLLVNQRAFIRLKDVGGQEIILDGAANNEQIRITSRNRQGSSVQQITLSSKKGEEKIEVKDKQGNTILIDPNGTKAIQIFDNVGNRIEFDVENGSANYIASNQAQETVGGKKTTRISGEHNSEVGGDDNAKVLGNKFIDVMNDLAASISGLTSVVLTGPARLNIANAQFSGTVEEFALIMDMLIGGVDIKSNAGKMHFGTLFGDVEVDTLEGDVTLKTTVGDAKVQTLAGNAELSTAVGSSKVASTTGMVLEDPSTIKIGSAAAIEPLVLGIQLQLAFTALMATVFTANAATWGDFSGIPIPQHPALVTAASAWTLAYATPPGAAATYQSLRRFTEK